MLMRTTFYKVTLVMTNNVTQVLTTLYREDYASLP